MPPKYVVLTPDPDYAILFLGVYFDTEELAIECMHKFFPNKRFIVMGLERGSLNMS